MAGQSGQRGGRPASKRGDFTGNLKEALQAEHEEKVAERREELGITAERQASIKEEGVVDLMNGAPVLDHPELRPEDPQLAVATGQDGQLDVVAPEAPVLPEGTKLDGSGKATIDVYELPEERAQAAVGKDEVMTPELLNEPTLIKVLYDLEDVTIGYGNTFNLRADYRYRVPRWVAAHLEEKGLCIVLSLSAA